MDTAAPEASSPPPLRAAWAFVCGLCMGAADAVPGVSGGTIALLLGIYERFIRGLAEVMALPLRFRDPAARAAGLGALRWLVPLGLGLVIAYLLVLKLLVGKPEAPGLLLDPKSAPYGYAVLFGVVLASIPEPWRRLKSHGASVVVPLLLGIPVAFSFTLFSYAGGEVPTAMLLIGGAGAISVMLLPGISGSLLLVVIGHYQAISTAVLDRDMARVGVFLLGILAGLVTFVPCLRLLLRRAHDPTMGALTGLMIGSLAAVWPFKDNYVMKEGPMWNELPPSALGAWAPVALTTIAAAVLLRLLLRRGQH